METLYENLMWTMDCNEVFKSDVDYIGNWDGTLVIDWEDFVRMAEATKVDWEHVAKDLVVMLKNGDFLYFGEWNGEWEYFNAPKRCPAPAKVSTTKNGTFNTGERLLRLDEILS